MKTVNEKLIKKTAKKLINYILFKTGYSISIPTHSKSIYCFEIGFEDNSIIKFILFNSNEIQFEENNEIEDNSEIEDFIETLNNYNLKTKYPISF